METYSPKPTTFMYFWLNYFDENHIAKIPIGVKNIEYLASEITESDKLHLFLLSDGTRIDEDEYLSRLEDGTELIICTEEQIQKLLILFELKRYLGLKNISYPLNIDYFLWHLTAFWVAAFLNINILMLLKCYKPCSKCFLIVFKYDFEQVKRVHNE